MTFGNRDDDINEMAASFRDTIKTFKDRVAAAGGLHNDYWTFQALARIIAEIFGEQRFDPYGGYYPPNCVEGFDILDSELLQAKGLPPQRHVRISVETI